MSIAENLQRIINSKNAMIQAITEKGVDVPDNTRISDLAELIDQIGNSGPVFSFVTIGNRDYRTVKIGTQTWLCQNLDYSFNGSTGGINNNKTTPGHYYPYASSDYSLDGTYKCGLFYNWYAVEYLEEHKAQLLPEGWRVSTVADWETLFNKIGTEVAGTKLKAKSKTITTSWPKDNWAGTDDYGFCVLPAGRYYGGTEAYFDNYCEYWVLDTFTDNMSYEFRFSTIKTNVEKSYWSKVAGMNVRLIKDEV